MAVRILSIGQSMEGRELRLDTHESDLLSTAGALPLLSVRRYVEDPLSLVPKHQSKSGRVR